MGVKKNSLIRINILCRFVQKYSQIQIPYKKQNVMLTVKMHKTAPAGAVLYRYFSVFCLWRLLPPLLPLPSYRLWKWPISLPGGERGLRRFQR